MLGKTICWLQSDFQKKDICLKTRKWIWPVVRELHQVLLHQCYNNVTSSMSHFVEVLTDVARMLLAIVEWPFNSSNTTWRISGTSCWVLNWKGTCLLVESFLWSAHKKFEGSRGVVCLFKSNIFRVTALVKGDRKPDAEADWHIQTIQKNQEWK